MENGEPYQYISIRTDITSRKQAENDLKWSMRELKSIYNALGSFIHYDDYESRRGYCRGK